MCICISVHNITVNHLFYCRDNSSGGQIVGQCCYGSNNVLLTPITGGGRDIKADPWKRYFEHYSKDLWPIIVCCEDLKIPDSTCQSILNDRQVYFKRSIAQGYIAPDYESKIHLCM